MTIHTFFQTSIDTPAAELRDLAGLWWAGGDGVRRESGDPGLVQAQATPVMSVKVNPLWGKRSGYLGHSDAVVNVPITTADSSSPRKDLIVMRWRDTERGDSVSSCTIEAIPGTPQAVPTAPSTAGMVVQVLAEVSVAAGTTSITGGAITDLRTLVNTRRVPRGKLVFDGSGVLGGIPIANGNITTVMASWANSDPVIARDGIANGATGIVVGEAGDYDVYATATFDGNNTGRRGVLIAVNDAEPDHVERNIIPAAPAGNVGVSVNVSTMLTLAKGDKVGAIFFQTSGASLVLTSATLVVALRG